MYVTAKRRISSTAVGGMSKDEVEIGKFADTSIHDVKGTSWEQSRNPSFVSFEIQ